MPHGSSGDRSICFLTYRYLPETVGGPIFYTHRIARHMMDKGWEVSVLARSHERTTDQKIDGIQVRFNPRMRFGWGHFRDGIDMNLTYPLSSIPDLLTHLPERGILHVMDCALFFPLATIGKRIEGVPIVTSVVQDISIKLTGLIPRLASSLNRIQTTLAVRQSDRITALSQRGYLYLVNRYPQQKHKIRLILGFLETDVFTPTRAQKSDDGFVILVPQRLAWIKDIETVLRAAAMAKGRLNHFQVRIAGEGPMLRRLLNLAERLRLTRNVVFLGDMNHYQQMPQEYASADLVVVPSLSEGGQPPQVVTEALAMKAPVAMSQACDTMNVLDGICPTFPPRDPERLARLLVRLKDNPEERRRIASSGHRVVRERYSIRDFLEAHEKLYEELLNAKE
jgi:glycosyltransferase involved in cell wall biosynthesis